MALTVAGVPSVIVIVKAAAAAIVQVVVTTVVVDAVNRGVVKVLQSIAIKALSAENRFISFRGTIMVVGYASYTLGSISTCEIF